jgi:hypothetical protein
MLTYCHGLGILYQRVVSLEFQQALIAHHKRTFHYTRSRQTTIIPAVFKHFAITVCTLVRTQYEKPQKNNRIHMHFSPHLHTKLYTGQFSRKCLYCLEVTVAIIERKIKPLYNTYHIRLDNGDCKPWPWEASRERTILSQRLDSLEQDHVLIAQHKRTFHYTRARPNPCIQVSIRFYALCSVPRKVL